MLVADERTSPRTWMNITPHVAPLGDTPPEPVVSATVSEKPRRGRPRRYHPDKVAFVMNGTGLTARGAQNKIHMGHAVRVLEPASAQYPELSWLLNRADGTFRTTILSELGRARNDEAIIFLAREVTSEHLKSREAVAYIRRVRRELEQRPVPPASARALAAAVVATVDDYHRRHPDMTPAHVRDGLHMAYLAVVPDDYAAMGRSHDVNITAMQHAAIVEPEEKGPTPSK